MAGRKLTTSGAIAGGGLFRYDDHISFDLPEECGYLDTTDQNGNRLVIFGIGPEEEDGKTVYAYQVLAKIVEKNIPGEDILDYIDEIIDVENGKSRHDTVPKCSEILIKKQAKVQGTKSVIRYHSVNIRLSASKALSIQIPGGETGEDTGYFLTDVSIEEASKYHKIWGNVLYDGKKLFDSKSYSISSSRDIGIRNKKAITQKDRDNYWAFKDNELMIKDGRLVLQNELVVGNSSEEAVSGEEKGKSLPAEPENPAAPAVDRNAPIYREGNRLVFGNLWSMEMPYACRLVKSALDDPDAGNYDISNGDKCIWNFLIANDVENQTVKALANLVVYGVKKKLHNAEDDLIQWQFRKDDRLSVEMKLAIGTDGNAVGQLTVDAEGHQYVMVTDMPEIDDLQEGLDAISNNNIGMVHPFGMEWENQWGIILRMIASIRRTDEPAASREMQKEIEPYKGFTCSLPAGFTAAGEEDGSQVYVLSNSGIMPGSKLDNTKVPLTVYIHGSKLEGSLDTVRIEPMFNAFAMQQGRGFGLKIRDDHQEGFYKNLSYYPTANGAVRIHALAGDSSDLSISLIPGEPGIGLPQLEIISIADSIFESLQLSDGAHQETVPEMLIPAVDYAHEHFDLIESHSYTTHRSADFVGQSIRSLMEKCDSENNEAYTLMKIDGDAYNLDKEAVRLAKVFRMNEDLFDDYADTEALIRKGMFRDVRMYHALRSLAWTLSKMADRCGRTLSGYSFDELQPIAELIREKNYLNYWWNSYSAGLCDTYDWHVYFVPEYYLITDCRKNTDLRYLTGKENRGGNTVSVFIPGLSDFGSSNRNSEIISRNEETLESLEALRKDLEELLPVMETIHDGLLEGRDRSKALEGPLADALTAWCALAIAAKEPFYSEEAADTPEADAALEEPLERPKDKLDDKPAKKAVTEKEVKPATKKAATKAAPKSAAKPAAKPAEIKQPSEVEMDLQGEDIDFTVLDVGGETSIRKGKFENLKIKNLEIPEGVMRIGEDAFAFAEIEVLKLPKSLQKIGLYAFGKNKNLRKVIFQEGLRQIAELAFIGCVNLKEVILPDTLQKVDYSAFVDDVKSHEAHVVVTVSGETAKRLYKKKEFPNSDTIYAGGFIIDGRNYNKIEDYIAEQPAEKAAGKKSAPTVKKETVIEKKEEEPGTVLDLNGEKVIQNSQFIRYKGAKHLIIPEGITEIGPYAFAYADFEEVTLPKSLKVIEGNAFLACENLKTIELPPKLEKIGAQAFIRCSKLTEITLPDSLKEVSCFAFSDDSSPNKDLEINMSEKMGLKLARRKDKIFHEIFRGRVVVDGKRYINLEEFLDFWKQNQALEKEWAEKEKAKEQPAAKAVETVAVSYDQYIPEGVFLTSAEGQAMQAVAAAVAKKKTAKIQDVAFELNETNDGAKKVLTGLKNKGVLDWTSSGAISLLYKGTRKTPVKIVGGQESATMSSSGLRTVSGAEYAKPYDEMISFVLPAGYTLEWVTNDDGKRKCCIRHGAFYNENGQKVYRFQAVLSKDSPADMRPGEGPVQALKRINPEAKFAALSTNPKVELMVKAFPMNMLGKVVQLYAFWLIVERNAREYFIVNFVGTWDNDRAKQLGYYRNMIDITNAIRINRQALPELKDTPEELMRKMPPEFDGAKTFRGNVQLNISVNGKTVSQSTVYGDDAGNIHSTPVRKKVYTVDMLPPGTENAEGIVRELNEMEPDKAEDMLKLLISVNNLTNTLDDLNKTVSSYAAENESVVQKEDPQKQHKRNALTNRIAALEKERDGLSGLFAGMKRKKIQREIDDLKDQLRRL